MSLIKLRVPSHPEKPLRGLTVRVYVDAMIKIEGAVLFDEEIPITSPATLVEIEVEPITGTWSVFRWLRRKSA